jgi:hypothetical protein
MIVRVLGAVAAVAVLGAGLLWLLGSGLLGHRWEQGDPVPRPRAAVLEARRADAQRIAASWAGLAEPKQILFGDLHVHTTISTDAFMMALPMSGGDGAHPVADACDFARFCSALDFWSINDHALAIGPEDWAETIEEIRQCNAVAGDPENPDVSAFLGWEWTQMGTTPRNHWGHKNVIFRGLADDEIPARPIAARAPEDAFDRSTNNLPSTLAFGLLPLLDPSQASLDMVRYLREMTAVPDCPEGAPVQDLPLHCREWAATPAELFHKLDEWGLDSLVIPHGTTWGFYTPHGSSWDKQLVGDQHDPARQSLIEIYSGHGNSEEYRGWREVAFEADGTRSCPSPRKDYLPSCWRAGEIIRGRCLEAGLGDDECEIRAAEARRDYVEGDVYGHLTVPGVKASEWLDSGQCRDCFQPSFNYRPKSSVQYILALRNFDDPKGPRRFGFGFIASSDNHSARPGTGYKEFARTEMTEARFGWMAGPLAQKDTREPAPASEPFDPATTTARFFGLRESERQASFFLTGGLVAVHAEGRSRDAVWDALARRETYGTSGPRILLWFDLVNSPRGRLPMGSETRLVEAPVFSVRAAGSFEQKPGCPEDSVTALPPDRLERLCRGECYHPSDRRRPIARIEIVRIRPQASPGEPVDRLIEDPWKVFPCDGGRDGCAVAFEDIDFVADGRDTLYYARAIEAPSSAVNADNLRCDRAPDGSCESVDLCDGGVGDDCLAPTEQRAWSSPIFIGHGDG